MSPACAASIARLSASFSTADTGTRLHAAGGIIPHFLTPFPHPTLRYNCGDSRWGRGVAVQNGGAALVCVAPAQPLRGGDGAEELLAVVRVARPAPTPRALSRGATIASGAEPALRALERDEAALPRGGAGPALLDVGLRAVVDELCLEPVERLHQRVVAHQRLHDRDGSALRSPWL
jgi:hypothetical protein